MFEREVCAEGWVIVIIGRGLYRVPRFSSHKSRSERSLIFPQTHPFVNFCQPLPATSPRRSLRGYKISKKSKVAAKMQKKCKREGKASPKCKKNSTPFRNTKKMQKKCKKNQPHSEIQRKCKKNAKTMQKLKNFWNLATFLGKCKKNAKKYKKNAKKCKCFRKLLDFLIF